MLLLALAIAAAAMLLPATQALLPRDVPTWVLWTSMAILVAGAAAAAGLALVFLAAAWFFSRRALDYLDRAQATAQLGEARLHATLQSCGDALIVTDEAGKVTMINPVAETLTGWRQNQAQGHPLEQVSRLSASRHAKRSRARSAVWFVKARW